MSRWAGQSDDGKRRESLRASGGQTGNGNEEAWGTRSVTERHQPSFSKIQYLLTKKVYKKNINGHKYNIKYPLQNAIFILTHLWVKTQYAQISLNTNGYNKLHSNFCLDFRSDSQRFTNMSAKSL